MKIRNKNSFQEIGATYQYWRDEILSRHVEENYDILSAPDIVDIYEIDPKSGQKTYVMTTDRSIARTVYIKDKFSIVDTSATFDYLYRMKSYPENAPQISSSDFLDIDNALEQNSSKMKKTNKIFISHSSKDSELVGEIIDILETTGIPSKKIFCSSYEGYGINLGENFLERLKKELNDEILVIFVLSENFYSSPISLCEMGATWIKTNEHIPLLIPPFDYDKVKGVFPNTQGLKINEHLKLNLLKAKLEEMFGLTPIDFTIWESKRDKILKRIEKTLNINPSTASKIEGSPNFEQLNNAIKMMAIYAKRNNISIISFEKIMENINPKFDEEYVMNLVIENPTLLSRYKLKNNRFGIKLIDSLLT
jgi:hypothetical protein